MSEPTSFLNRFLRDLDERKGKLSCQEEVCCIQTAVEKVIETILLEVSEEQPFLTTTLINCGSYYEGTKVGKPDEFDFYVQLNRLSSPERGEERAVKFLFSLFFSLFFSLLPNFFRRFSLLPDFSPFSLISLLRGLFYLLLNRSASFPHVLKRRKTYETRLLCRYILFFPYYLSVLSRKLEAFMFTTYYYRVKMVK